MSQHNYLKWLEQNITDFSATNISLQYDNGFVFGRVSKGYMSQTRSLRINLAEFELSSENRRILNKTSGLTLQGIDLPISNENYDWNIHKLGKDFYQQKFGSGVFTAAKIKELLSDQAKSNYNLLLKYTFQNDLVGYAICYKNSQLLHYAYPFYDLTKFPNNFGIAMMLTAICEAQKWGLKYMYLGSFTTQKDTYKLQFKGLEWFDKDSWQTDQAMLKSMVINSSAI